MNLPAAIYRYTADGIEADIELCLKVLDHEVVSENDIENCAANIKHAREAYELIKDVRPYLGNVIQKAEQKLEEVQNQVVSS